MLISLKWVHQAISTAETTPHAPLCECFMLVIEWTASMQALCNLITELFSAHRFLPHLFIFFFCCIVMDLFHHWTESLFGWILASAEVLKVTKIWGCSSTPSTGVWRFLFRKILLGIVKDLIKWISFNES